MRNLWKNRPYITNSILCFFQKIKRPVALKGVASKKRSEITSILARESIILEVEEGRQLVKTKVKDPPFSFNADYSQQNNAGLSTADLRMIVAVFARWKQNFHSRMSNKGCCAIMRCFATVSFVWQT